MSIPLVERSLAQVIMQARFLLWFLGWLVSCPLGYGGVVLRQPIPSGLKSIEQKRGLIEAWLIFFELHVYI